MIYELYEFPHVFIYIFIYNIYIYTHTYKRIYFEGNHLNFFISVIDANEARLEELARQYLTRESSRYACTLCPRTAGNKSDLKLHIEAVHFPTNGAYVCQICDARLNTKKAFKHHKSAYHRGDQHYT